jgi:hypothetical protein
MQVRKLLNKMEKDRINTKATLIEAIPILINETEHLKKQWRFQIVIYVVLDVLALLFFSIELQFIIANREDCSVALVPLLLFMFNIMAHLFSFLFAIAILNDSFSKIESAAWRYTGWKIPPQERSPEQISAMKDPEVAILMLGLATNKMYFRIGFVTIDWAFIGTVSGLAGTLYGLAIPS